MIRQKSEIAHESGSTFGFAISPKKVQEQSDDFSTSVTKLALKSMGFKREKSGKRNVARMEFITV